MSSGSSVPSERPRLPHVQAERPHPNGLFVLLLVSLLAYLAAGFVVYWQMTGSTSLRPAQISELGAFVLFGPLLAMIPLLVLGARGPLARLYERPIHVWVDGDGVQWQIAGQTGAADWETIETVIELDRSQGFRDCALTGPNHQTLILLPRRLVGPDRHRSSLIDLVVETRPDLFEVAPGGRWKTAIRRQPLS